MNWKKVDKCKHEWSPAYHDAGSCMTPYCSWYESHCLKCRVFSVECACGAENSLSGEPRKKYMRRYRKKHGLNTI